MLRFQLLATVQSRDRTSLRESFFLISHACLESRLFRVATVQSRDRSESRLFRVVTVQNRDRASLR